MFSGWEWIIIGVIAIVVILWGPAKIPELAKALGRAKGEFDKAQKEFTTVATETAQSPPKTIRTKDEILLETAKNMGILTEGKTKEQISTEIAEKAKALGTA